MTQDYLSPFVDDDALATITTNDLPKTLETLATLFSGAAAPPNPFPNQLWVDTTNNWLKQRDPGGTTWVKVLRIGDYANKVLPAMDWGTVSASVTQYLLVGDGSGREIIRLVLLSNAGSTSSSGNEVTFDLYNVTQAVSLFSGTVGTFTTLGGVGGGEIVADTPYILAPDQNATISSGDVLELRITYVGAPTATLTRFRSQVEAA